MQWAEPLKEEILRVAERCKATGGSEGMAQFLAELIDLGFEHRLQQLYQRFEHGEMSLGYFAQALGLGVRDLYAALEQRGLPTANIGGRPRAIHDTDEETGTAPFP